MDAGKKWTERDVAHLRYDPELDPKGSGACRHWEPGTPGFGIVCRKTGARRYAATTTVSGTRDTPIIRVGEPGKRALKDARSEAVRLLDQMRNGIDPRPKA